MECCEKCLRHSIKYGHWPGLSALKIRHFECYKKCVDALSDRAKSRVLDKIRFTNLEYFKYAVDAKCTVELNVLMYISDHFNPDIFKYLYENGHVDRMSNDGHLEIRNRLLALKRIDCLEYLASIDKLHIDNLNMIKKNITQTGSQIIDSYILGKINDRSDRFLAMLLHQNNTDFAEKVIHKYPEITFPRSVQASVFRSCIYGVYNDNVKVLSFSIRYGLIPDLNNPITGDDDDSVDSDDARDDIDDSDDDSDDGYIIRLKKDNSVLGKLNYLEMMARSYICPKMLGYIRSNRSYIRFALWYTVPTLLMVDKFRGQLLFGCVKDIVSYV